MLRLDTGNTAFTLLCASLVMLMTPGLAFFYGGLVGRKNVLATMMQSFILMAIVSIVWAIIGYSLGGWVAEELALTKPERINAAVFVGSLNRGTQENLPDARATRGNR